MPTDTTGADISTAHRDSSYSHLPNKLVRAANGIDYAYRDTGPKASDGVPLVLLQRFHGNSTTGTLVDALASARRVIAFEAPRVTWRL